MSKHEIPEGYEVLTSSDSDIVVLGQDVSVVQTLARLHSTLYAAAKSSPGRHTLTGRVPTFAISVNGEPWLVRHFHRGGAVAVLLGDRYARWSDNRALHELIVSTEARTRGIATPEVIAAAQYRSGVFARYDIILRYIPDTCDLAALLFDTADIADTQIESAARLITSIVANGLMHPDLNLKNIIVSDENAWVIDLDRSVLRAGPSRSDARAMHARFVRSLEKWQRLTGRIVAPAHRRQLEEAFGA